MLISSDQPAMRVPRKLIERLVGFVASQEGARVAQADIAVVASKPMAALNNKYLSHAGDTDVITFDLTDAESSSSPRPVGRGAASDSTHARGGSAVVGGIHVQIIVCADIAVRQGRLQGTGARRELLLYITHGLLHVMGYEDHTIRGAARMHAREEELLRAFGV